MPTSPVTFWGTAFTTPGAAQGLMQVMQHPPIPAPAQIPAGETEEMSNAEDFARYYSGCTVYLGDKLVQVNRNPDAPSEATASEYVLQAPFSAYTKVALDFKTKKLSLQDFFKNKRPFVPLYGYIPISRPETVAYISLVPQRQWQKGFSSRRCRIFLPNQADAAIYSLSREDTSALPIILRDRTFMEVGDALENVRRGRVLGAAISADYALVATLTSKYPILFKKTIPIGYVNNEDRFIATHQGASKLLDFPKKLKRRN